MAVPRISKEDLKQRLDGGAPPVVVDARLKYPYEHSTVRIPGAIRYSGDGPAPALPRDREIVVYCAAGVRSSLAASILERSGRSATNLRGGFNSWVGADLPIEP